MAKNLRPHLQIQGYFGTPGQLGITRSFAANEALNAARARKGGAPGLGVVGEQPSDALKAGLQGTRARTDASAQTDETRRAPVALSRRASFTASSNDKGQWSATTVNNESDWESLPNPFGAKVQGLYYSNATPGKRALFAGPTVAKNAPIALRLFYFKGDFENSKQIGFFYWGLQTDSTSEDDDGFIVPPPEGTPSLGSRPQWGLQFFDGQFSLQRLSATWTQDAQTALETLLCLPDPSDAQEAQIAVSRQNLYISETSLSVSGESFARMIEVTIEADETGAVWLNFNGEGEQVVELPDVIATRKTRDIWKGGAVGIGCNQGAFMWQLGTVKATKKARLYLPSVARMQADPTPGTAGAAFYAPAGTGVTFGVDEAEVFDRPWVELTSTGARTPVLHDVFYSAPATPRTPDTESVFDSDDPANQICGGSPVASVSLNWGGEMKRLSADVTVLVNGGSINVSGGEQHEFWAERVGQLLLGNGIGERMMCKGLIQEPTLRNAKNPAQGVSLAAISGFDTELNFKLVDFWQIADEWLLREMPVGDGEILGDYLELLLGYPGFTEAERAGLSPSIFGNGPTLPKAAPGEKPLIQPEYEQSLGDFLRWLMDEYAPACTLDCYSGVWRLRDRNYAARVAFSTASADPSGLPTFPIRNLDIIRDYKDTKTHFCGQGAAATPGAAPVEWKVGKLVSGSGSGQKGFQGRIRRAKTEQNDAWRTRDETMRGTRGKVRRESRPGRFFGFQSDFCAHLVGADLLAPGDRCYVSGKTASGEVLSGVLCEIETISGGSIERNNDSLNFLAREVITFA